MRKIGIFSGKNLIWTLVLSAVAIAAVFFVFSQKEELPEISVEKAKRKDITRIINVTGKIESADLQEISLPQNREVDKVYVEENEIVQSGQILAEINSEELIINLQKAEIELQQLNAELKDTLDRYNSINRQKVFNAVQIAKEEYELAENYRKTAEDNLAKTKTLYENNGVSLQEYQQHQDSYKSSDKQYNIAKLKYEDALAVYNDFDNSKALTVDSIKRQIQSKELEIEKMNLEIDNNKIYASVSGKISDFPLKEKSKINPG